MRSVGKDFGVSEGEDFSVSKLYLGRSGSLKEGPVESEEGPEGSGDVLGRIWRKRELRWGQVGLGDQGNLEILVWSP